MKFLSLLLQLTYWAAYLLLVAFLFSAIPSVNKPPVSHVLFSAQLFGTAILPALLGFYTFYFLLFEQFLERKRFAGFSLFAAGLSLVTGGISYLFIRLFGPSYLLRGADGWIKGILIFGAFGFVHGILSLVVKAFANWYDDIRLKRELRAKNEETEIILLKSKTDPHFLFNSINNIDMLLQKDPVKASDYLNKLSDLLRFVLYETSMDKIALSREIEYIERYLDLQRLRSSNENLVSFKVRGNVATSKIQPMIFIPFVENAFKHADLSREGNVVDVEIERDGDDIRFSCVNHYSSQVLPGEAEGIGNTLIRQRLDLCYPGAYHLETGKSGKLYTVRLSLKHVD